MTVLGKRKAEDASPPRLANDDQSEDLETVVQDFTILETNPFLVSDSESDRASDVADQPENVVSTPPPVTEHDSSLATYVQEAKNSILDRISERSLPTDLSNLSEQYDKLLHLLEQTVKVGESNSCLLIGNRGSGKSVLVRKVIQSLRNEHKDNFLTVELNGLIQTDDRSALREITRQLTRESQMDDRSFTSFAESLAFLLSLLKSGSKSTTPVIFILDEFDLFAQHTKQALLYNLFDIAQSSQNPIAVVGLTCRMDTMELLEKRVKSRFSHRQIYLYPPSSFGDFSSATKSVLSLPMPDSTTDENHTTYIHNFNEALEALFQDPLFLAVIRRIFDLTKDLRMVFKICFQPVSSLSAQKPFLTATQFYDSGIMQRADSKTELLKGVSLLELILIVSMGKLLDRETATFNFQMVYDEYKDFMNMTQASGHSFGMKLYKRAVALKAFEHLQSFELVCPVESVAKCPKEYRMMKIMLEHSQISNAVAKYRDCPTAVKKWGIGNPL
ncbi:origin recognition complex subunit 4 C-terminus-domain-containing protein [Umbelopsis sp. AD052]|nr:origin recognition complex subunit 4 C-terminus-domain-containing protein [Umbelopsis sp. AD052]